MSGQEKSSLYRLPVQNIFIIIRCTIPENSSDREKVFWKNKAMKATITDEAITILRDLNPWWETGKLRTPAPRYRRRGINAILQRLTRPTGLIEVLRGPRQVGKTTAIEQAVHHLLISGINPRDIFFIRFDQEVIRESRGGLRPLISWYADNVRKRRLEIGTQSYIFLDEIHKLDEWDSEVKDFGDTFPVRILLTGSSSVLV
ncbi:MAG TPA: AAA family ATPase, partial [Gemmataceae bacterium]|nr:AAA family ATPase [Gemmataceae bacterium]